MRRASFRFVSVLLAAVVPVSAAQSEDRSQASALVGDTIGLDHVLLWAQDRTAAEAFLTTKLGFQLGPTGSYGQGIRHNIIRFPNRSFIEFLWLSDPAAAKTGAPWAYDFVSKQNGSNAFGVQVESVDAAYKLLKRAGLRPDEPMAEALDPDGPEGPKPPIVNEWRFMFLGEGAAPGDPFFVEYKPKGVPPPPTSQPNGAVQLQSVWIVVSNLAAARSTYGNAGLSPTRTIRDPRLNASGVALQTGDGEVILISPNGAGALSERLKLRGDHVVGMSIRVQDMKATRESLRKKLDHSRLWETPHRSVVVDAIRELGAYIEFQE